MLKFTNKKIVTTALFVLSFTFILMSYTNTFDYDFGWHLRFGRDLWQNDSFPYLDTYTYTFFGKPWVNHEWGMAWIYWLIYNNIGYFSLQIFLAIPMIAAFIIILKTFRLPIGPTAGVITFLVIQTIQPVLVYRPSMFLPLFLAILLYCLENLPKQKNFYWWPLLFWLWSILHGSWILGFIVISIYIAGNLINNLAKKYFPQLAGPNGWTKREYKITIYWSIISGLIILINPYGWHLWREVITYFDQNFYKTIITEWVPTYTFPIYWKPLMVMAATIPLAGWGLKNKNITWSQGLLYIAFWWAAFIYKRHMLIFAMVAVPILTYSCLAAGRRLAETVKFTKILTDKTVKKILGLFSFITIILLEIILIINITYSPNIWAEKEFLTDRNEPAAAVEFLTNKIGNNTTYIFNYFSWGGFLEWAMPNAQLYLDGRGTVSWMYDKKITMLEHYRGIIAEAGGLKKIEAGPAEYIIWKNNRISETKPDFVNHLIFPRIDAQLKEATKPLHLEEMLIRSPRWEKIYDDNFAIIWQKKY